MVDASQIKPGVRVIGADGVPLGTVDRVEGQRIKLAKAGSGEGGEQARAHYIALSAVSSLDGDDLRLAANADVVATFEEEG